MSADPTSTDAVACDDCQGSGTVVTISCPGGRVSRTACRTCKGTGSLSPERLAALAAGEARRANRLARGLSLRQEAARIGIGAPYLSRLENP